VHTSNYTVPGRKPIPSNGLIVDNGDELIMVDTAWGEKATESLLAKIETEIGKPVKKLIITHHHLDKLAGVDVMEFSGVEVFTHPFIFHSRKSFMAAARSKGRKPILWATSTMPT